MEACDTEEISRSRKSAKANEGGKKINTLHHTRIGNSRIPGTSPINWHHNRWMPDK